MTESTTTASPVISILSASRAGNLEEVAESLRRGDDVNARGKEQRTALMLAATGAHLPTIEILLKSGAQPDLSELITKGADWRRDGVEALHLASGRNSAIAQKLIGFGVDPKQIERRGGKTLDIAIATLINRFEGRLRARELDQFASDGVRARFLSGGRTESKR